MIPSLGRIRNGELRRGALALALAAAAASCSQAVLQPPRNVVLMSGGRVSTDPERLDAIHEWVLAQLETITCEWTTGTPRLIPWGASPEVTRREVRNCFYAGSVVEVPAPALGGSAFRRHLQDPAVHIQPVPAREHAYPWQTLVIQGDTARVQTMRAYPDVRTAYTVYAYLHLMAHQGRIERWLPEAVSADGYALERAIVRRMADAWLMGRSAFFLEPYGPLDELLYAAEAGHLDAFLFTLRPDEFPEARQRWLDENPGALDAYRAWFRSAFGADALPWTSAGAEP